MRADDRLGGRFFAEVDQRRQPWLYLGQGHKVVGFVEEHDAAVVSSEMQQSVEHNQHPLSIGELVEAQVVASAAGSRTAAAGDEVEYEGPAVQAGPLQAGVVESVDHGP